MKKLLVSLSLLALVGCGSNGTSSPPSPDAYVAPADAYAPPADTYIAPDTYVVPDAYVSPLDGTWTYSIDANDVIGISFKGNTWKAVEIAVLTDGSTAAQIDSGTFTISGSTITLIKTASSCEGVTTVLKAVADTFSVQGSALTLLSSSGTKAVIFQLDTSTSTGTGAVNIGCFDSNGNFTPHAVTTVP